MTENIDKIREGKAALESGDIKTAIAILEEVTRNDADNYDAFVYLALSYSRQGRFNPAIGAFIRASEIKPESQQVHYNLGRAYEAAGVPEKAEAAYKRALEIDAFYTKAHEAIARLAEQAENAGPGGIHVEGE